MRRGKKVLVSPVFSSLLLIRRKKDVKSEKEELEGKIKQAQT